VISLTSSPYFLLCVISAVESVIFSVKRGLNFKFFRVPTPKYLFMQSRLDKLFELLECTLMPLMIALFCFFDFMSLNLCHHSFHLAGPSTVVRKNAALQIGETAKEHFDNLQNLLERTRKYLHSKEWETRMAAAEAIECIATNVPPWNPKSSDELSEICLDTNSNQPLTLPIVQRSEDFFTFDSFDLLSVLKNGAPLLASGGQEYEDDDVTEDPKIRIQKQRKRLKECLGLGGQFFSEMTALVTDEDLMTSKSPEEIHQQKRMAEETKKRMEEFQMQMQAKGLSARQRLQAKRKMKQLAKQSENQQDSKRQKVEECSLSVPNVTHTTSCPEVTITKTECFSSVNDELQWPFEIFCDQLFVDLFDMKWEIRHGAAIGLRAIFRHHALSAGKKIGTTLEQQQSDNLLFIEDAAIRCLCVLALDRFTDYSSDRIVAPVRETVAQVLALLVQTDKSKNQHTAKSPLSESTTLHQSEAITSSFKNIKLVEKNKTNRNSPEFVGLIRKILQNLQILTKRDVWEERYGGFLGIKYLLATRDDLLSELVSTVLPLLIEGLKDPEEEIRAVVADSLLPLCRSLLTLCQNNQPFFQQIDSILTILWNNLISVEDFTTTASTANIMNLLAELYTFPQIVDYTKMTLNLSNNNRNDKNTDVDSAAPCNELSTNFLLAMPRLFPFFEHSMSAVRMSVTQMYERLFALFEQLQRRSASRNSFILQLLQLSFQNLLLERHENIVNETMNLWRTVIRQVDANALQNIVMSAHCVTNWLKLLSTPDGIPFDSSLLLKFASQPQASRRTIESFTPVEVNTSIRMRGIEALSELIATFSSPTVISNIGNELREMFSSSSATKRFTVAALIANLCNLYSTNNTSASPDTLRFIIGDIIQQFEGILYESQSGVSVSVYYDEVMAHRVQLRTDFEVLRQSLQNQNISFQLPSQQTSEIVAISDAIELATTLYAQCIVSLTDASVKEQLEARRQRLLMSIAVLESTQSELHNHTLGEVATAVAYIHVSLGTRPQSGDLLFAFLMKYLLNEREEILQQRVAEALARLMFFLRSDSQSEHTNRIVWEQLTRALCSNTREKVYQVPDANEFLETQEKEFQMSDKDEIQDKISQKGAKFALEAIARVFGPQLFVHLPQLNVMIAASFTSSGDVAPLIDSLHVVRVMAPFVHSALHANLVELMQKMAEFVPSVSNHSGIRKEFAMTFAVLCRVIGVKAMEVILTTLLPMLQNPTSETTRLCIVESVLQLVNEMEFNIVPYILFLIGPIMSRMSDQCATVRRLAAFCFASLVKLMPLENAIPNPEGMHSELIQQKERERQFLEELLYESKRSIYHLPIKLKGELRKYQQEGINWLAFLKKFNLHGILCDDMGLGKTVQALCIIMSDHFERRKQYQQTRSAEHIPLPSLIICPPTLINHWVDEVDKFFDCQAVQIMKYYGPTQQRAEMRKRFEQMELIISSYEVIRNDIESLKEFVFNYCVLDEGHIIKNVKAKVTQAVKQIRANHRLILTGTPIQNNVLELWSLFDFLMPGYLGNEKQFAEMYSKPILISRDAKASSRQQEAGILALETLHRQVLPFILRRVKDDVLHDLPPRLIQDYYCDLSPLQVVLYENFTKSQMKKEVENVLFGELSEVNPQMLSPKRHFHIFQALQYLRKLCSHPALVLTPRHPMYPLINEQLKAQKSTLRDVCHAPKLLVLRDLLLECGIGIEKNVPSSEEITLSVASRHRALIFCQFKSMLDIIETDLFQRQMPTVSYLRLDGSVTASERQAIVHKFNSDISIDCLLLTTSVGGLGLNLSTADTVIFCEHDWNPMRDLQAMDRAHRIGQKKVVTVYRIITRGTIEEKIMGLQKFKLAIANTVVDKENQSFQTMNTSQLLDLFNYTKEITVQTSEKKNEEPHELELGKSKSKNKRLQNVLSHLNELWDETQYSEEYDIDAFITKLK
jgi:TATA-binding protein-associated factor